MSTASENQEAQRVYWDGAGGDKWIKRSADIDINVGPAQQAAIEAADIVAGMRVLDIGCGCGGSTLALAQKVGVGGKVVAADISHAMIAIAQSATRGLTQVDCMVADAATHDFGAQKFDRLFSRFGVMFFGDPAAAFAQLRAALKPDGRLTFVCWRPLPENPWMLTPLTAVCRHAPRPQRPGPEDPGPFSFGDPARVRRILTEAGFAAPEITKFDFDMDLALGRGLEAAVETASNVGAASAALTDQPPEIRAAAVAELRKELAPYERDGSVNLGAAVWIVSAARG